MVLYREQDYFHCEHCNSFHFPAASQDGVRLFGEAPEGSLCPNCRIPLHMATLDDTYRGFQCKNCQGLLLARSSFRLTVETRRAKAVSPPDPPKPLNPQELSRKIDCPTCHQPMITHPYLGPGTIVIDTCDPCNTIWLDYGELSRVINAPGKDRGSGMGRVFEVLENERKRKERKQKKHDRDIIKLLDKFF